MYKKINLGTFIILLSIIISTSSCGVYSFTGASVDTNVKTISIDNFPNLASLVAPSLSQSFSEKLKDKCVSDTRLTLKGEDGDIAFSGDIINYYVQPAASGANDQANFNRLTIAVRVEYINQVTDKKWSETFEDFENFDANSNLSDMEDELIELITDKLVQNIFNRAFTNW